MPIAERNESAASGVQRRIRVVSVTVSWTLMVRSESASAIESNDGPLKTAATESNGVHDHQAVGGAQLGTMPRRRHLLLAPDGGRGERRERRATPGGRSCHVRRSCPRSP